MKRTLRILSTPLGAAALIALLDALVGHLRAQPGALDLHEELSALRLTFAVVFGVHLLLGIAGRLLVLRGPRAGELEALGLSITAGLFAWGIEIDLLDWDAARHDPMVLRNGVVLGLLVGFVAFRLLAGRLRTARLDTPGVTAAVAVSAAIVAAPFFLGGEVQRPERAVTSGHRVPRVILIIADTLRRDALSTYAAEAGPTPVLDSFADSAYCYTKARTPGAWTLPSVTSALTGLHPLVHGATTRTSSLPEEATPLAEHMAAAGYRTAAIGHNFVLSPSRHLYRGFDQYLFTSRKMLPTRSIGFLFRAWHHDRTVPRGEPDADEINARLFHWLDEHGDEDFFLWLHYYDTHIVYDPPVDMRPAGSPPPGLSYTFTHNDLENVRGGYTVLDQRGRDWVRSLYDAEARGLDRALGRVFEDLKRRGLWEDSLVIVTSDHGEEFFEHEGFEHGHTVYEELLDVPLFVKLPRAMAEAQRAGGSYPARIDDPVSLENIAPTILELAGVETDRDRMTGGSLLDADGAPLAAPASPRAATGTLYFQDRLAVMVGSFKYIRLLDTGREELFNLADDPLERRNLVPQAPPELALGRARFDEVLASTKALADRLGIAPEKIELDAAEVRRLKDIGYAR
ncbi:MAG TPA: hypothetical protein ENJ09_12645 [Planctomycetes bacterium]|nr:hypothetical protein [Planctomycetota bacterium]